MKYFYPLFAFLFTLIVIPVYGQKADSIIAMNIEARGGLNKLRAITSVQMTGTSNVQNIKEPFTIFLKRPDLIRLNLVAGNDTMIQAYDGQTAWAKIPVKGTYKLEKLSATQAADLKEQADIDGPLIDYKKKGIKIQYAGTDEEKGQPVYKLRLTRKNGNITTIKISKKTYFTVSETSIRQVKSNPASPLPDKLLRVKTYFSKYESIKGIVLPYSIETYVDGNKVSEMDINSIDLNIDIKKSLFEYPAVKN
ncbi:MAG TPA: hypothetical protein VJ991_08565 [Balneolales bacterium]|nr:hypothetical protein [Balneolales bacterium]